MEGRVGAGRNGEVVAGGRLEFKKRFRCQDLPLAAAAKSPGSIWMNLKIAVSTTAISDSLIREYKLSL